MSILELFKDLGCLRVGGVELYKLRTKIIKRFKLQKRLWKQTKKFL